MDRGGISTVSGGRKHRDISSSIIGNPKTERSKEVKFKMMGNES
jgi:hypothetical protein